MIQKIKLKLFNSNYSYTGFSAFRFIVNGKIFDCGKLITNESTICKFENVIIESKEESYGSSYYLNKAFDNSIPITDNGYWCSSHSGSLTVNMEITFAESVNLDLISFIPQPVSSTSINKIIVETYDENCNLLQTIEENCIKNSKDIDFIKIEKRQDFGRYIIRKDGKYYDILSGLKNTNSKLNELYSLKTLNINNKDIIQDGMQHLNENSEKDYLETNFIKNSEIIVESLKEIEKENKRFITYKLKEPIKILEELKKLKEFEIVKIVPKIKKEV